MASPIRPPQFNPLRELAGLVRGAASLPALVLDAPRGTSTGSPVMVLPGYLAGDGSTLALRTYLASHAGQIVMQYAALAFLGFGADSGAPDWGAMLYEYRFHLFDDPALVLWPGLAILFFVLGLYLTLEPDAAPRRAPLRHRAPVPLAPRVPAE